MYAHPTPPTSSVPSHVNVLKASPSFKDNADKFTTLLQSLYLLLPPNVDSTKNLSMEFAIVFPTSTSSKESAPTVLVKENITMLSWPFVDPDVEITNN